MSDQGALDNDFDDAELSYDQQLENALDGIQTEPMEGGIAIDLVTRQPMFVRRKVADSLEQYYHENSFDLATYNEHPYLPVRADDAVFECVFLQGDPNGAQKVGKTYDYPRGRLMTVPVHHAWQDVEVGDL